MMNAPPPSKNPYLVGHTGEARQVTEAFKSGRMHHAWLITGAEGIGKKTLAWHIAHHVLSGGANPIGNIDMSHPAARMAANEAHPDLFVLRKSLDKKTGERKNSISVEDARGVAPFLRMTSTYSGGWRAVVVEDANALTVEGQNAILKIVEEPPEKSLVLITSNSAGALLPTIRSRCRLLPLRPLGIRETADVLVACGVGEEEALEAAKSSHGSPGLALKILETEAAPIFSEVLSLLEGLPALDIARLQSVAEGFGKKADSDVFSVVSDMLLNHLREAVSLAARGNPPKSGFAGVLVKSGRLDRALQLWEKAGQTLKMAERSNLDKKLAFINAVVEMKNAVKG